MECECITEYINGEIKRSICPLCKAAPALLAACEASESCLRELSKAIKGGTVDGQSVLLGTHKRVWNLAKEYADNNKAAISAATAETTQNKDAQDGSG